MTASPSTDFVWTQLSSDLRRFIRRRVSDDHVADDLLQETFLRIHGGISALNDADRLAPWVYQIARNVIHDFHRKAPKSTVTLGDDVASKEDAVQQIKGRNTEWLEELILQLPETYRQAVLLSEIEGLPQQEVADRLGLSLSGAKSRVQRGRTLLKDVLDRCCVFHFDRRGNLMDMDPKPDRTVCKNCDELDQTECAS